MSKWMPKQVKENSINTVFKLEAAKTVIYKATLLPSVRCTVSYISQRMYQLKRR